jgi:hypothetical protein
MTGRISMSARRELVAAVAHRYRAAERVEKGRILDELTAVTGWHRKHAVRALNPDRARPKQRQPACRIYSVVIRDALIALWEASDRVCGKRLKAMIPVLLPALERHGRLALSAADRELVLTVSAATIDRMLSEVRIAARGGRRRRAGFSSAVRRAVPVRTFDDWRDPPPGFCEADLVAHGGMSVTGSFIQTLTMVDVATGWTECFPLLVREGALVVQAIERAQSLFPWLIRGLDFDNDSAFMNDVVVPWCRAHGVMVTRSRAYKKNDQAFVEQKNGAVVRRLVGYGRFEGIETARALARLYAAARLYVNFFQPSFKLKEKRREGAKIIKRYHAPATPCERALAHPALAKAIKRKLRAMHRSLDPVALLAEVREAQAQLGTRVDQRAGSPTNPAGPLVTVASFAEGLGKTWKAGERRTIHRRPYVRRKPVPRRPSMLDPYITRIEAWLAAEPHLTAVAIVDRLSECTPGSFGEQQLRTLQRFVKTWRARTAKLLIDGAEAMIAIETPAAVPAGTAAGQHVPVPLPRLGNIVT